MIESVFFNYFYLSSSIFITILICIFTLSLIFSKSLINFISSIIVVSVLLISLVTLIKYYVFGLSFILLLIVVELIKETIRYFKLKKQKSNKEEIKTNN